MIRLTATPKEISEMLALREAGFTALAISQRTGFSIRTIHRHLSAHGSKKGRLKADVIENARSELLDLVTSSPVMREQAAKLISDDLAHSIHIRNIVIAATEHLIAKTPQEAMLVMRAAAAYSTVIKNTSDTIRHSLGLDKLVDDVGDLPKLVIEEITNEKAVAMRGELVDEYE